MRIPGEISPKMILFDQEHGKVFFRHYRMVLLSACAFGALRRELIETLGCKQARGVLKRFGYAAGFVDANALIQMFGDASQRQHLDYGSCLQALEGMTSVDVIHEKTVVDFLAGRFHMEAYWDNSFEAEQHLSTFGRSDEPVCWTLMGYATGHSSAATRQRTLVVETECRAMGSRRCRFVADFDNNFPEDLAVQRRDYQAFNIPAAFQELERTIEQQQESLKKSETSIAHLKSKQESGPTLAGLTQSDAMRRVVEIAERVAPVDATVLISGEKGSGKELLARGIHERSKRSEKPFVAVHCSALPESLQEAELFGYAKGSFAGATSEHESPFESANGGTLFLDEIGDLSLAAQTKVLRALEEGEIKRLGENRARKVYVRVLAATDQDLEAMVAGRQFQKDLYLRLNVVSINLPPLRERDNDILLLSDHFLRKFASKFSKDVKRLSTEAKRALAEHNWPGNVRELENVMERAVILAEGNEIELRDLPEGMRGRSQSGLESSPTELSAIANEQDRIVKALELSNGNREDAAAMLGMGRTTLWRKMQKYGLDPKPSLD